MNSLALPSIFLVLPRRGLLCLLMLASLLSACGGGGGGSSDASTSTSTTFTSPPTLTGVAAVGAPLVGAKISVVDAKGAVVGSATTHGVDGSFSLTLTTSSPTGPLLLQARGMDASGTAQVLHGVVPTVTASMVALVTPLSDAIVALSLGTNPRSVFAAAAQSSTALANLNSTTTTAASDFVKTLVKTQLTDLKITDLTKLNLISDASFTANKSAQDLLIESLRVAITKNSKSVEQLQISNKLLPTNPLEVTVDLATAQTELLKTTGATPANAISSTLKAATSPTATLALLPTLDDLGAALNTLIAQGPSATTIAASTLLSKYDQHNGSKVSALATKLADYASKNRQFGKWLITGCADDAITGGLCNKVMVSAPISDSSGSVVDIFSDAVSYNKSAATGTPKWYLIGNGRKLEVTVIPLAFTALDGDGATSTSVSPNPSIGVQALIQAQTLDTTPVKILDTAQLQTPGGYSIPFANCALTYLCVSSTTGTTSLTATGGLGDTVLQQPLLGWLGSADSVRGAKYIATYTVSSTAETRSVYLRADVPTDLSKALFPVLDGVSTTAPLRAGQLLADLTVTWSTWAAANPNMRLISIHSVASDGSSAPLVTPYTPPLPPTTTLSLTALTLADGFIATSYELWLGAQDTLGRRYYTRYTLQQ